VRCSERRGKDLVFHCGTIIVLFKIALCKLTIVTLVERYGGADRFGICREHPYLKSQASRQEANNIQALCQICIPIQVPSLFAHETSTDE